MSGQISVVVINFNGMLFIEKCLKSILSQSLKPFEIIVVDNSSCDGSLDLINKNYSGIKIIENNYNIGFCRAANQGINFSKGEYVAILNVDVELEENFFWEIFETIPDDGKIGIVTGKILRMRRDSPSFSKKKWDVPGDIIDSTGQFIGRDLRPKERGYKEFDTGRYDKKGFVFSACAACCIYKKDMLNDIKINNEPSHCIQERGEYFDEDFFSYSEDFDLAWRAYYKGWKAYYVPTAICWHVRGGSFSGNYEGNFVANYELSKKPIEIQKHIIVNRYIVLIKNAPIKLILMQIPYIIKYEIFLLVYLILFHFSLLFMTFFDIRKQFKKRKLLKKRWTKQCISDIYKWII